jgi:tetratricopeptide (TPR) repeat protein
LRKAFYLIPVFFLLIFLGGCSSKSSQTSFAYKSYHDLTARFNRYFNSKLIMLETLDYFKETYKDNYEEILPLYVYGTDEQAQSKFPDMDDIIKKSSENIKLHENSKWIDDAYLYIGEAYFMKKEYEDALPAFIFITSEFDKGIRLKEKKVKKSKKKKKRSKAQREKDKNTNDYYEAGMTFSKHKPARWRAMIWIIKTYAAMEKFSEGQSVIAIAIGDKKFPEELKEDLYVAMADLFIKQGNNNYASNALNKAMEFAKKKADIRRYAFIMAQVNEKQNLNNLAIEKYKEVLELNPDYEMEFHAKINIARISQKENLATSEEVIELLNSLTKSEKYKDFLGEVYYTLGEIYHKEKLIEQSIDYFNQSIASSREDDRQKAKAYLKLGEIYFENEDYELSKIYHDSTLMFIDKEYADYDAISDRKNVLQELVTNLDIIADQDSLQYLGSLSEEDLKKFIDNKNKIEDSKKKSEEEEDDSFEEFQPFNNNNQISTNWPFDNPNLKSTGYNEFKRLWGDRPKVDNWRRIASINQVAVSEEEQQDENQPDEDTSSFNISEYSHLPRTEGQIQESNEIMELAYYKLGYIYKDKLNNSNKAIDAFETLFTRFPDNKYRLETAYNLYLLHKEKNEMAKAKKYKDLVINDYPESVLAKILIDPNYIDASKEIEQKVNEYYAKTYNYFLNNDFENTLSRKKKADSLYPGNLLQPKFDMLEALVYGKIGRLDTFKILLQNIVNKYTFSEVRPKALAMLNALEGLEYDNGGLGGDKFKYEPETNHFIAILFVDIENGTTEFKNGLARFNDEYYSLEGLKISSVPLNNNAQLVLVKRFDNAKKAKTYYNSMRYNTGLFEEFDKENYEVFFISEFNYGIFFREKDINGYMAFFTQKYLSAD